MTVVEPPSVGSGRHLHRGIVKLKLTAVFDAQHGGFTTGWSPASWGSIDELLVNLTMPCGDQTGAPPNSVSWAR